MSLRDKLLQQKEEIGFISVKALEELITPAHVQQFSSGRPHEPPGPDFQSLLAKSLPRARKLVAVLILAELDHYIPIFIAQGATDDIFRTQDMRGLPFMESEERARLAKEQTAVPPILREKEHLLLPQGTVLPFLQKKRVNHGSFGIVYRVTIARGHLDAYSFGTTETADVALKEIVVYEHEEDHTKQEDHVMREVIALRRRHHPNLVPLLASFTIHRTESGCEEKVISMLFPYAEMDMEKWLRLPRAPADLACLSGSEQRQRLYAMTSDLVSALAALHREVDGLVTSHHDLKPSNILVTAKGLMIADLGMSDLVHLGRNGGSETDETRRIGTKTYRPPEYYMKDTWERNDTQRFGRAFDMWAMGCVMVQVAILIVWGWESTMVEEFHKARQSLVAQGGPESERFRSRASPDDSFVRNTAVVDEWLSRLQEEDGSLQLQGFLAVAVRMLRANPTDRILSWEAELDLHELLHPDAPKAARSSKTAALVQHPTLGKALDDSETPLHRAAARGNLVRAVELLKVGWPARQKDKTRYGPAELARLNGHLHLYEILSRAEENEHSGRIFVLDQFTPDPPVHVAEQRGFRLRPRGLPPGGGTPATTDERLESLRVEEKHDTVETPTVPIKEHGLGRTPLHVAAQRGDVAALRACLVDGEAGKAVHLPDNIGRTPLHYASKSSAEATTAILEAAGNKMQLLLARDQYGSIPLHLAVEAGRSDIAHTLILAWPDKTNVDRMLRQEDQDGVTPLDMAEKTANHDLRRVLDEVSANAST